jgi:hypothetical protein
MGFAASLMCPAGTDDSHVHLESVMRFVASRDRVTSDVTERSLVFLRELYASEGSGQYSVVSDHRFWNNPIIHSGFIR